MSDRIDLLQKIVEQGSKQQEELFRIASKQNGEYLKMEESLQKHFKDDDVRFGKQDEDHIKFAVTLERIENKLREPTIEEKKKQEEDFDARIEASMKKAIYGGSKWGYSALLVIAGVFGALLVIGKGFGWLLGLLGFVKN